MAIEDDIKSPDQEQAKNGDTRKQRRKKRAAWNQRRREKQPKVEYKPLVRENENLVNYYKMQPIMEPQEFDAFLASLKVGLAASFRINTFELGHAVFLRRLVQGPELGQFLVTDQDKVTDESEAGDQVASTAKLEQLSWYPKRFGWQMNTTRLDLKKSPILQQFHKFLMAETDNGFISRQETVSMIPPLVLDIHRGQNVLDMCAAPGSKTAQLLEYLKYDIMGTETPNQCSADHLFDDGMVVANELDNKRCYMLVHQSSRLNSPNCVIINQDASRLPAIKATPQPDGSCPYVKFDRVLCDVPCSGDGTIRKNPDVWAKWSIGNTNNFHGMQVKILRRGIELLKKDGLVVYSTCSMSPIEDEAVIAAILRMSKGTVKLEDFSHRLPGLKFRPGVSKWVVLNRNMEVLESYDMVTPEYQTQHKDSMFPPTEDESKSFDLHKCIRILPHLQNTGGFFVAVLRKTADQLPWEKVEEPEKKFEEPEKKVQEKEDGDTPEKRPTNQKPNAKKRKFNGYKEEPFFFMEETDPDWINVRDFYGLKKTFPYKQLLYRCQEGKKRCMYLVSKRIRDFIIANKEEGDKKEFLKIINAGMRLFHRASTESGFRICQDGVSEVLPYINEEFKVPLSIGDLALLLKNRQVPFQNLDSGEHIKEKIKSGSFIFIFKHQPENGDAEEKVDMPFVAWRGEYTATLYVSRTYRIHLLALAQLRIGDDGGFDTKEETNNGVK